MPIGQTVVDKWPFSLFFKMAAVRDFELIKIRNLNADTARKFYKFHADQSNHRGDMAIFKFFKNGGNLSSCIFKTVKL